MKKRRMIQNIPTSKIRSLAMGLVEIFGTVSQFKKNIIIGPLSGKKCVYYKYKIEEHRGSGKHSRWVTIRADEKGIRFDLKDNTGTVLVDPKGAKIDIRTDFRFGSRWGMDPPKHTQKALADMGLSFEGFFGINKNMRFTEWVIEPKDKVYILGTAMDNPFFEEATAQKGIDDVMIGKGKHDKTYYISDKSEKDLLKNLMWKTYGGIFGGGFLFLISLFLLFLFSGFR